MKHSQGSPWDVSRETSERLAIFRTLLLHWNKSINLIGRATEGDVDRRHFADCLQLMAYFPAAASECIDLGSGAGFPGLVLAIATGRPFVLVEADRRKAAFLRVAISETGAPASVIDTRIEDLTLTPADLVTARALASLDTLLDYASRLLKPGGMALFLKGAQVACEVVAAQRRWRMQHRLYSSQTSPNGAILAISELTRASA